METVRIEAFSGMVRNCTKLIRDGRVEEYRQTAYELPRK